MKLEDDWCAADIKLDAAAMGRILASDYTGIGKGAPYKDRQALFTDVFIRRDGPWQAVASQATLIATQQK